MTPLHTVQGVLSIDKPSNISSHDVVNRIRRLTGIRRVGHAGTLDPLATGVLLVCIGRATRLVEYLVGRPKWYEATIRLGQTTDSYDADGDIVAERPFSHITPADISRALMPFQGEIQQLPPMFSAIKKDGQPLYKLARQGIEIERTPRTVNIYRLELLNIDLPFIQLRVHCSTGTYIRSLAHDLGAALGCGAHITALRRTAVGDFDLETAVSLTDLTPEQLIAHLHPIDRAVAHLPRVDFAQPDASRLLLGQSVTAVSTHPESTFIRAYDYKVTFLGIIQRTQTGWQAQKMFPPLS